MWRKPIDHPAKLGNTNSAVWVFRYKGDQLQYWNDNLYKWFTVQQYYIRPDDVEGDVVVEWEDTWMEPDATET